MVMVWFVGLIQLLLHHVLTLPTLFITIASVIVLCPCKHILRMGEKEFREKNRGRNLKSQASYHTRQHARHLEGRRAGGTNLSEPKPGVNKPW